QRAGTPPTRSLFAELRNLEEQVRDLRDANAGTYPQRQERLEQAALAVEGTLALQGARTVRSEIITEPDQHVALIKDMIRGASQQIVIAGPFVSHDATLEYRSAIMAALQRGCAVFLLLGIGETLNIDPGVSAWIDDTKKDHPESFFCSRKSARCHA